MSHGGLNRVFRGDVNAHNAVSVSRIGTRTSHAQLRWTSKGIDPTGEHASLCVQGAADYLYEAGVDDDQLFVCGAHAISALAAITFTVDTTEFTHAALNRVKYAMGPGELAAMLNAGRKTFHLRVGALQSYRLPRSALDAILNGAAVDVDYGDHAINRVITHVMRLINGNPYNLLTEVGTNRQAALLYLYAGHVVEDT